MAKPKKETAIFHIESDLLKELGERLVSESEVALTELIKNSYDADANECRLTYSDREIRVADDGTGMTERDFLEKWMTIATSNKLRNRNSRLYSRSVTGSKGIGRFAVRFLGNKLTLTSIAYDEDKASKTKLVAEFDWLNLDKEADISDLKVPYSIEEGVEGAEGTTLLIEGLKHKLDDRVIRNVKSGALGIESPLYGLHKNAPTTHNSLAGQCSHKDDIGFSLIIGESEAQMAESLSNQLLSSAIFHARVIIDSTKTVVEIYHCVKGHVDTFRFKENNPVNSKLFADLYWFPRRAGVFQGNDFDGRKAWSWVRDNSGVVIFDHGFRVRPYGAEGNDWLMLDHDSGRNRRNWRTKWAAEKFPIPPEASETAKLNPMLKISTSIQMVGAVFVETNPNGGENSLAPSMDRQGFVENEGFQYVRDAIRFSIEAIAHFDKKFQLEEEERERRKRYAGVRENLNVVIKDIKASSSLNLEDKDRLITHYSKVSEDVENLEEYDRKSREGLEAMSLLGVVAGFMTHEFQAALMELERAKEVLQGLSDKVPALADSYKKIEDVVRYFVGYIDYTKLFIGNLQSPATSERVRVVPSIEYILNTFERFQIERNIKIDYSGIDSNLKGPKVPVAIYHGIFHNLYTNALKALINHTSPERNIKIVSWNEKEKKHILQVMDNGPGIPDHAQNMIWDPMYTTTSSQDNPLGSGMGLGLPLVKKVIEGQKGKISLQPPPHGFTTCFRVELPIIN